VIETHEHKGDFREVVARIAASLFHS